MIKLNLIALLFTIPAVSFAQNNQLLVLSGGGSPASNHYSQYLQTKTVYEDLSSRLNYNVDLFFGAGNNTKDLVTVADVHKIEKRAETTFDKYIVGTIKNNSAATKSNVFQFFKTKIKPQLDTFFMVISDHGMPNIINNKDDTTFSNNCIDLWNAKVDNGLITSIGTFENTRCLSKNELKNWLIDYVPAKKKVFAMSQCFSGGFHQMSVDESGNYPKADTNVCGFTAITHDSWASGCSPDVDGPTYQGYERSFTEQLTGFDYVNNKRLRPPRNSFLQAHRHAILEDLTVDIPLSTSEYYLWRWSLKLLNPKFVPRTQANLKNMRRAFEQAANFSIDVETLAYKSKKMLFIKMGEVIKNKFPEIAKIVDMPLRSLQSKVNEFKEIIRQTEDKISNLEDASERLYDEHTFKLWEEQLTLGSLLNLNAEELEVEKDVLNLSNQFDTSGSRYLKNRILPILWAGNASKGEMISIYLSQREDKINQFALNYGDFVVSQETKKMMALDQQVVDLNTKLDNLTKQHGLLRRLLIYRQVLGAWTALSQMNDTVALKELTELMTCENSKL